MNGMSRRRALCAFCLIALALFASSCRAVFVSAAPVPASALVSSEPATACPPMPTATPTAATTASPLLPATLAPTATPAPQSAEVSFIFTGDIMFHPQLLHMQRGAEKGTYDFTSYFENIAPLLQSADFTIGNLEAPVNDVSESRLSNIRFAAPPEALDALKTAGFDALTTANNHALDQGLSAVVNTVSGIEARGMLTTGTYRTPEGRDQILMLEKNGVKVALLAYTCHTSMCPYNNKGIGVNLVDKKRMQAQAAQARAQGADAVILCMHFGTEYTHLTDGEQRSLVRAMREAGVTAVVGAHPHVLQPVTLDAGGTFFAAYSLGNLVTPMNSRDRQFSALLKMTIHKDLATGATTVAKVSFIPTWAHASAAPGEKVRMRVFDLRQALADCQTGKNPLIPRQYLRELTNGMAMEKRVLGEQYIEPLD